MLNTKRSLKVLAVSAILFFHLIAASAHAEQKMFRAQIDDEGVQKVEVVGGEYYFDPDHIIVKVNVPVELTLRKTPGFTPHNIIIKAPEAGIDINIDMSGDPETIIFTPTKTGTFDIYCDKRFLFFKSHKDRGMKGVLEVVE